MEQAERYESQKRKQRRKGVLPFHIQHNIAPAIIRIVVTSPSTLPKGLPFSPRTWDKIKAFVHQLGVLARDGSLAPFGERLRSLLQNFPDLLAEAVHGHLYTMHHFDPAVRFSFAYATICDWLWERGEVALTSKVIYELVSLVVERGSKFYQIPEGQIAFSQRRNCHPLTVAWGLSVWCRLKRIAVGKQLVWRNDLEEFLSRCLLLDDGCAKIAVEVAANWTGWRESILEAQKHGELLAYVRLNRLLGGGEN